MKKILLKQLLPETVKRQQLREEEIDLEIKKAFDSLMSSLPSKIKSVTSDVETQIKGKSDEELAKLVTDVDPLLGKLAQESIIIRRRTIKESPNKKDSHKLNEEFGIIFFAGIALALPPIIDLIGNLAKIISKKFGGTGEFGEKMAHLGHELHAAYHGALRGLLDATLFKLPSMKMIDEKGKKKITDSLFVLIITYMALYSGGAAVNALRGFKIGSAVAETALSAIKSGEVVNWVTATITDVLT